MLCVPDQPFGPNTATARTTGSQRKTVFTADGTIHMAWIESMAGLNKLLYWNDTMGLEAGDEIFQSYDNIREVSLDVGPDDRLHLVLVVDDLSGDYLHHIFTDDLGNRDQRMTLIPGGVHNPSVTSLGPNAEIVFEANGRCDQENLIGQLKSGAHALKVPVDNLLSNWAYMVIASLAWTFKAWFGLTLPRAPDRKEVVRMEFRRFLHTVVLIPAQVLRTGRRLVVRLLAVTPLIRLLFRSMQATATLTCSRPRGLTT